MPRVLLLITHLEPGGAQDTVAGLAAGLPSRGFDVTVAAGPRRAPDAPAGPLIVAHLDRDLRPFADARAYGEISRLLAGGAFDVVHTHSSKAGVLGRLAARRRRVRAVVHTSHGLPITPDMGRVQYRILGLAERIASRACHRVIAVSESTASDLERLNIVPRAKVVVIPSGVPIPAEWGSNRTAVRARLGLGPESFVVGWVGRHFPQKRPDVVVATARAVLDRIPEASFLLAGDGPLLDSTRASAADEPRIRILGHVSDVEEVYAAIDALMLASAWEGLPRTVLEALARGIPTVSTDVGGVAEVLHDGENGFLVPGGDPAALADALVTLARDPARRERMGRAARLMMSDAYSVDRMIDAHARLYDDLLGRGASTESSP